jgi:beta-galactosidase
MRPLFSLFLLPLGVAALSAACGQSALNVSGPGRSPGNNGVSGASGTAGQSGVGGTGGSASTATRSTATGGSTSGGGTSTATASSAGSGVNSDGGMVPTGTGTPSAVYNGLRGEEFNAGWKFNLGDVSGANTPGFDDSKWRVLDVPHDWSIELAFSNSSPAGAGGGYLNGGIGWYRNTFTLDQTSSNQKILIEFDGVYMNSQVWINGTSLGTRPYGYSTFEYDLSPYVKFDGTANVVAVQVNNNQPNSRWYSGSGIYRNVWLTKLNSVHVPYSGVFVTTPQITATSASVSVSTDVQNQGTASAAATVTTTIYDASGTRVATNDSAATNVAANATATVGQTLQVASPQLWSVASPYLYRVTVEVKIGGTTVDTYVTSLGIRTAAFSATSGFSLNGQNMKLQGVNMHHDLGALGTAVNYRAIERQVQILKSMGVNAIRTSHNPPAPELLDIADRLGMLVLEEAFDTWRQPKTTNDYALYFSAWAQRDIQGMVMRDRNHPSIVLWSIGNEISGGTTADATSLRGWVRAIDSTRAVTWASNKMAGPHYVASDHDIAALLDVAGYNYAGYAGDYDADHAAYPNWKLLGTEISAALRSRGIYHTPADTVTKATSSTRADQQCSSYDNEATNFGDTAEVAYTRDVSRPFVAGSFVWSGFDYIGEPTPYGWPAKSAYYGIVDTAGFPKDIYYFYKSRWTTAPMVHILPHWNWTAGTSVTVYAYSNCDSVELFLNGKSQGSQSITGSRLHMEWSVPWASGTLRADCTTGGSVVAQDTVTTAGQPASVLLSADRNPVLADGKDLVFVTADVQDANGVEVPTAANAITFSVSGPGQLVGVDNGNPIDTSSYKGVSRNAFSGKALAIVATSKTPGTITVEATSSGLSSKPLTVTSQ